MSDETRTWLDELPAGRTGHGAFLEELLANRGRWTIAPHSSYSNAHSYAKKHGLEARQRRGVVYMRAKP